ncbi:DUF1592 domain-containing protein [Verrucomicrobiales bacterium BCK34]|nr:DUF1592 domain-containing protein [Verrucomicrobiales bacterium BCK34]
MRFHAHQPSFSRPLLTAVVLLSCGFTTGAEKDVRKALEPILSDNCYECHDDTTDKGSLNLLDLEFEPGNHSNFERWARILERVETGEMPPPEEETPLNKEDIESFVKTLDAPLLAADLADKKAKGRVNVRRLTRTEYEHTMHDLLGIGIPLQVHLPEDPATHNFETVASGQQFSHFNLARYLETADLALDAAIARITKSPKPFLKEISAGKQGKEAHRGGNYRGPETVEGTSIAWPMSLQFYGRMPSTTVPESGWYRITIRNVHGINPPNGVVWGTLSSGECASNAPLMNLIGLVEATKEKRDLTFEAWIQEGHMLELKPNDATYKRPPSGATGGNVSYKGRNLTKEGFVGLANTGIRMERIYPEGTREEVKAKLLPGLTSETIKPLRESNKADEKSLQLMEKTIHLFASRAFRRPVATEELKGYFTIARETATSQDHSPLDGIHAAYRAILCSPRFLTLTENDGRLDDHALASRLSYMLWNSMPDGKLRKLADEGKLSDYKVRHAEVKRLLEDPKSERFINSFTDQWLNLKEINFTSPDRRRFKTFDPIVQESILSETRAFVKDLIHANRNISNLILSDHAMLNERLVRFYGMEKTNVKIGEGLQKVSIKGSPRGGLITQGSVLKVTADGTTTSPVVRGVWMAERILGMEIPPPPPGVPAVEPDIRGAVSIRDQLEKHRNSVDCASCHRKLDPAGFALESFDPVGNWRTKYGTVKNAAKIDPSGITPDGTEFKDISSWKNIYVNRRDLLTEGFAKQLITYATGAPVRYSDRDAIKKIVKNTKEKGYGMKSIIHEVVASEAFLRK